MRVASSYIKRFSEGNKWKDDIGKNCKEIIKDILKRAEKNNPVKGEWFLKQNNERIWCDESDLAIGVALETDVKIVKDGCWIRKKSDC